MGKILWVELTKGEIKEEKIPEEYYDKFLSGYDLLNYHYYSFPNNYYSSPKNNAWICSLPQFTHFPSLEATYSHYSQVWKPSSWSQKNYSSYFTDQQHYKQQQNNGYYANYLNKPLGQNINFSPGQKREKRDKEKGTDLFFTQMGWQKKFKKKNTH